MAPGQQAATGVDRDPPVQRGLPALDQVRPLPRPAQAKGLGVHQFGDRECVVQLDDVDVPRTEARRATVAVRAERERSTGPDESRPADSAVAANRTAGPSPGTALIITAPAPSPPAQHCSNVSGSAIIRESSTSSRVTGFW